MKIYNGITELIGNTPLLKIDNIVVKLENFNPSGSVKDRPAFLMLDYAIREGLVNQESVIVEPTSGNTGIGLAMCCASFGLRLILTMPESMSIERQKILRAYGAELVLTPKEQGMQGAVDKAKKLLEEHKNSFMPSQFDNPSNPLSHELTTAKEIFHDTGGNVDVLIAGIGTGGTATGCAKGLKALKPTVEVIGVEPAESPLITQGKAAPHKIQGIGANFIPGNLDMNLIDRVITITADEAIETARLLAKRYGILCGISSGANVKAALDLAKLSKYENKLIVAIICDTGERYLSTELFE